MTGRPLSEKASLRLSADRLRNARLQGESDGRTHGRISERSLIVKWIRFHSHIDTSHLANLIETGAHTRE